MVALNLVTMNDQWIIFSYVEAIGYPSTVWGQMLNASILLGKYRVSLFNLLTVNRIGS